MLLYRSSYIEPQSGLMSSTPRNTEEQKWFWSNGRLHCVSVPIALSPQRQFLCCQVYPDRVSRGRAKEAIQHITLNLSGEWKSITDQMWWKVGHTPQMGRTALWKLKRSVDPFVNTQPRCLVGKRSWTEGDFYLPHLMSVHGAFNTYLFHMKLAESLECANCDRRGQDDDDDA